MNLDDGGTYHASRSQRWLWECWLNFVDRASKLEGRKVLLLGGDLGELDTKRRSNQIITPNKSTILSMVLDAVMPMTSIVDRVIVIRGTQAHTGKAQWLEEAVGHDLDNTLYQDADQDVASWYYFRGKVAGVRIDAAHHAPLGSLPWTRAGSASKIAFMAIHHYLVDLRIAPPHLVLRAHNHHYADSGRNHATKAIYLPAWQLITEYGYRVGKEISTSDIGGLVVECDDDGNYQDDLILYQPKENKKLWLKQV